MTVYSYSRVNTYFTCPAQFKFRYLDKTPSPVAEGVELFLGSRFHESMEFLYHQIPQRIPTVNEVLAYFDNHWKNLWEQAVEKQKKRGFSTTLRIVQPGQTPDDYFQKGRLFLENYYHHYHPFDQDKTEGIEMKVLFNLDPKGEFQMQGYLDRLGRDEEGVLWIHDYKTSSRKLSAEDAKSEDQLALYQLGLEQNPKFGPKEKVKLIWHFVAFEKDQVVAERNPRELGWLKEKYVSKIQTIEKAKSYPTKPGVLCSWCEYLTLCSEGKTWVENRKKGDPKSAPKPAEIAASPAPPPLAGVPGAPTGDSLPGKAPVDPWTVPKPEPKAKSRRASRLAISSDQLPLF